MRHTLVVGILLIALAALGFSTPPKLGVLRWQTPKTTKPIDTKKDTAIMEEKIEKSEEQWRRELSPEQYHILREAGTERAFTGAYWDNHEHGVYRCGACGLPLFDSKTKFDSGTGWPSFYAPINESRIDNVTDSSLGMVRTEVRCRRCGSHLGHVFDDGPKPTGLRYCLNSAALKFEKTDQE